MAFRIESGRLDKAQRTQQGGLLLPASVGKSGCLAYTKADGSKWVEYRPPEEAFSAESLASLRGAPVTDLHPATPVSPETYRSVAKGHAGDDSRRDGEHAVVSLYVLDAELIRGVETGARKECSAGYNTDLEVTPGVAPDGTRYDAIQRNIRYNHVALGPTGWGRAGPTVGLRLDSKGNSLSPTEDQKMNVERIDGVDYEVGSDSWKQARVRHDAELSAQLAKAKAERDEALGRVDAMKAENDPERIRARVAARVALERDAASVKPDLRLDGLSDREIMLGVLGLDKTDLSDDYLRGRFDLTVQSAQRTDGDLARVRAGVADATQALSPAEEARRRMIATNRLLSRGEV